MKLGPIQTRLHSCAEPNSIRFDFGATLGTLSNDDDDYGNKNVISKYKFSFS